ncbi:MAG: hypothetical protein B5M48_00605 [Candidatus Omnitrophica bacterium 4484_213]|nr:MAG: hypothetical protein B5M48_00605 [Candidatus Omnitrophica bacterium 4484_213]
MQKILFLDRDGVINRYPGERKFVTRWEEFHFLPNALKAIRRLTEEGYEIKVISNQSGIAKGIYSQESLNEITRRMIEEVKREGGKMEVYYCPHREEDGCDCRKPKIGLFLKATQGKEVDPSISSSQELELLSQIVHQCTKCPLARTRTHYVFGEGNNEASLLFVGEAPGEEEDRQGKPFVGKAGQLLTRIIQSIGLKREDVYITNILKCRPPGNRNPLPQEIKNCFPYLKEQIRIIRPRIICALGKFAAQTLLGVVSPISQLRGRFYDYEGICPVNSLALGGGISPSAKLFNR